MPAINIAPRTDQHLGYPGRVRCLSPSPSCTTRTVPRRPARQTRQHRLVQINPGPSLDMDAARSTSGPATSRSRSTRSLTCQAATIKDILHPNSPLYFSLLSDTPSDMRDIDSMFTYSAKMGNRLANLVESHAATSAAVAASRADQAALKDRLVELADRFGIDLATRSNSPSSDDGRLEDPAGTSHSWDNILNFRDDNDHYDAADLATLADLLAGPGTWAEVASLPDMEDDPHSDTSSETSQSSKSSSIPFTRSEQEIADVWDSLSLADSDMSRVTTSCEESDESLSSEDMTEREILLAESETITIKTGDNILTPAPRVLLVEYVSFFNDLPPFLKSTGGESDDNLQSARPTLELPSATSGGMRLVIGLLRAKYLGYDTSEDPFNPEKDLDFADLQNIVDALVIADAYDIPSIPAVFAETAYYALDARPRYAWAIGTLAGGHICIDFPSLIADTLKPDGVTRLPPDARNLLHRCIPDALAVLEADQARWMRNLDALKFRLLSDPMSTGIDRYSLKCLGRTKRYTKDVPGCVTHRDMPDWWELRKETAQVAMRAGIVRGTIYEMNFKSSIWMMVDCERCADRLIDTFIAAVRDFEVECPPRCEPHYYCETCYYDAPKDYFDVDGPLVSAWEKKNPGVKKLGLWELELERLKAKGDIYAPSDTSSSE